MRPAAAPSAAPLVARMADLALGFTALGWVVRALLSGEALTPVGAALACLNLVVGVLFVLRRFAVRAASVRDSILCLLSVPSSAVLLALAPAPELWPWVARGVFVGGAGFAVVSLLVLGRSFGVLPAFRGLVQAGPYRLVRHPIYLGELVMVLGCAWAARSAAGAVVATLALGLVVLRIRIEERHLSRNEEYRAYRQRARFRLVPGLW
jgi:protein-S-isoprenylcysteine O-methyltransferase Ste14